MSAREKAISLLARREHSRKELHQKLLQKGFAESDIIEDLDALENKGWLSDFRFTESWIRHRIQGGYGPYRIQQELNAKGVGQEIINEKLDEVELNWFDLARQVWRKKYSRLPESWEDKAKQIRFLQYRGFYTEDIETMFNTIKEQQGES
nr:recombination regulator RecX [Pleionea sediminis]